jgi:hypothetical protein
MSEKFAVGFETMKSTASELCNSARVMVARAIKWLQDNSVAIIGAIGAIAGVVALVRKYFPRESGGEGTEEIDPDADFENQDYQDNLLAKAKLAAKERNKMHTLQRKAERSNKEAKATTQAVSYRVSSEIGPALRKNLWEIQTDAGQIRVSASCLGGRRFLLPRHAYVDVKQDCERIGEEPYWNLAREGVVTRVTFDKVKLVFDFGLNRDLLIVDILLPITPGRKMLAHFATKREATSIYAERIPVVAIINKDTTTILGAQPRLPFESEDDIVYTESVPTASVEILERNKEITRRYDMISYQLTTKKGSCGSLVVCNDKIIGMHTSGNGAFGHASRIDLNDLSIAYEDFAVENDDDTDIVDFPKLEAKEWIPSITQARDLGTSPGYVLGILPNPTSTYVKEDMVRYLGFSSWPPPVRVPVKITPEGYAASAASYKPYPVNFDHTIAHYAAVAVAKNLSKIPYGGSFAPLTVKQAIEGDPMLGIPGIDLSTSPGFPECTMNMPRKLLMYRDDKGKVAYGPRWPALAKEIALNHDMLLHGIIPAAVFVDNAKYELRSVAKRELPRLVFGSCQWHFILSKCFFGPFTRFCAATVGMNPYLIGFDPATDWDPMEREFIRFGGEHRHMAGDYKDFDKRGSLESAFVALEPLEILAGQWGKYGSLEGKAAAVVRLGLIRASVESVHARGDWLVIWMHSWASGNYCTALINSCRNECEIVYAFAKLAMENSKEKSLEMARIGAETFHVVTVARFLGDDNRLAIREGYDWFNMESLGRVLKEFGEEYTTADKSAVSVSYDPREKASLFKRVSYYYVDIDKYVGVI